MGSLNGQSYLGMYTNQNSKILILHSTDDPVTKGAVLLKLS